MLLGCALGMLARLHLQQGDYAKARAAADSVISGNRYRLVTPFSAAFNTKLYNGGAIPAEVTYLQYKPVTRMVSMV
ncbi:MAG: hypothetical protein IPO26_18055 [Saprospiraceae bacterium]|nr:hypothetical protein [Saprospiraceae bacterium]